MFRIRYYDQLIHPERFNKGMLGLTIRTLNWMRWKLEVQVQKLVLKYECREANIPKTRQKSIREMFSLDVEAEKLQAKVEAPHIQEMSVMERPEAAAPKEYISADGTRPERLDALAARYTANPRARRYARGRNRWMDSSEDAFEVVPATTGKATNSVDEPKQSG